MQIYILLAVVVLVAIVAAYAASHTVRGWVRAVWLHWFKDSEVNLGADLFTVLGFVGTIVADPTYADLFAAAHISPTTLLAIGLIIRVLKASRNKGALPFTSTEDAG